MRTKTAEAFLSIMECFNGADGGAKFLFLRSLVEEMDKQAEAGDRAAEKIVGIVTTFNNLILTAEKLAKGQVGKPAKGPSETVDKGK